MERDDMQRASFEAGSMPERSDADWVAELKAGVPQQAMAIQDLRVILLRGMIRAFANTPLTEADLEDLIQDSLLRIIEHIDTYRGEARFTTWATKITVHAVYSELRRMRWRDVPLEAERSDDFPALIARLSISTPDPEQRTVQDDLLNTLGQALKELSPRQREALLAVHLQGIPVAEVAASMDTNSNALYKLVHDARVKLRDTLLATGIPAEEILNAFS